MDNTLDANRGLPHLERGRCTPSVVITQVKYLNHVIRATCSHAPAVEVKRHIVQQVPMPRGYLMGALHRNRYAVDVLAEGFRLTSLTKWR